MIKGNAHGLQVVKQDDYWFLLAVTFLHLSLILQILSGILTGMQASIIILRVWR